MSQYKTAWGDTIPSRDDLDDGCKFDYFDFGHEVKKQTAIWRITNGMDAFPVKIEEAK